MLALFIAALPLMMLTACTTGQNDATMPGSSTRQYEAAISDSSTVQNGAATPAGTDDPGNSSASTQPLTHALTHIFCDGIQNSHYSALLRENLPPAYTVETTNKKPILHGLSDGTAIETSDTVALPLLGTELAKYWYPHYLSTVVIAIDRDQTDAVVTRWTDIPTSGLPVSMSDYSTDLPLFFAAISYSLEGATYSLRAVAPILTPVHMQGSLHIREIVSVNNISTPLIICFDDQAAAMIRAGRNLEIIIPEEGTLSFAKGLLSNRALDDLPALQNALIDGGLRLLDGSCDENLYPPSAEYARAAVLNDYTHLNTTAQSNTKHFRRDIRGTHRYNAANGQEQQLTALLYITAVIIWTGSITHRAMQKGVRRATYITSILLVGWTIVRMLKFQLFEMATLGRYLWYSFYLFELGIPLVLLWLSSAIDRPEGEIKPPKWWRYFAKTSIVLALLVTTNDLHQLVFTFDFPIGDWNRNYGYAIVFYIVTIVIFVELVLSQLMIAQKSRHSPGRPAFLLLPCFYLLLVGYAIGYMLRVPVFFNSDLTITIGVFTLLYIEVCIRIDLIPVNTKYRLFFNASPQRIQIMNHDGVVLLRAADAPQLSRETCRRLEENPGSPQPNGEDELLYADPISGGMVVWHEDIRIIRQLNREIAESVEQLNAANTILEQSMTISRSLTIPKMRLELLSDLKNSIRHHLDELTQMLRHIPEQGEPSAYLARIAMLVCYIKRKCHLFFLEQRTDTLPMNEMALYMEELSEYAAFTGLSCAFTGKPPSGSIPLQAAVILYNYLYRMFQWLYEQGAKSFLIKIGGGSGTMVVRTMQSDRNPLPEFDAEMLAEIETLGGSVAVETLEGLDSIGFCITFPEAQENADASADMQENADASAKAQENADASAVTQPAANANAVVKAGDGNA